jgi:putative inorganic carbon (HCO3(-)) transporter
VIGLLLRPLQLGIAFSAVLYLATMAVFLFRPPDLDLKNIDRAAFGLLVFFVGLRTAAMRDRIPFLPALSLPMLGLIALAVVRALREPFDAQTWSLVASKFVVPFVLMHVAILVFRDPSARRHFDVFILLTLAYLVFTAIAFLSGAKDLIFPRFILDESLGHHIDRARGPFLQAVANGMSLNMLGILALVLVRKHRKVVLLLWLALPVAILATLTRAAWIAFAVSTVALGIRLCERCLRRVCVAATLAGLLALALVVFGALSTQGTLLSRAGERGPLEARVAVYQAGWAMFQEHPLTGWTAGRMYEELARRMEGFHLRSYYVHNTYLSLLIELGLPGLLLYGFLLVGLFRLARADSGGGAEDRAVSNLRKAWPVLLCVFLFNACFVDMVYQFVNGLLFTAAGILWAGREAAA